MPGGLPGGEGMLKLRFDRYIIFNTFLCLSRKCGTKLIELFDFFIRVRHQRRRARRNGCFRRLLDTSGAFHLVKISGIFGSAVHGTRFVGSSHWKIPRKSGKSKKVVPFSRLEFPNGISCSIYHSRTLYQFQVHGRAPPRTGVYDQMEQLFTNRKFHFCYHRNFQVFLVNGKRPCTARTPEKSHD